MLSMEVIKGVIGHVYLIPLHSSDHLERKWKKTKTYHIRDTSANTQRFGTEGNLGASNLANVSFKLKCQLLEASLGIHSVRIYHNEYFHRLNVGPLILYSKVCEFKQMCHP